MNTTHIYRYKTTRTNLVDNGAQNSPKTLDELYVNNPWKREKCIPFIIEVLA